MEHTYTIHNAEKEKPEIDPGYSINRISIEVLVFKRGGWSKMRYSHSGDYWFYPGDSSNECPTHWTSLPPDPPKPKKWVKREIVPGRRALARCFDQDIEEVMAYVPKTARNIVCTFEVEEEQP